jgi:putative addiction module CopG family antidote
MPNIDLGDPYESYVKGLIGTGLYSTYAEVVKDALRLHMNNETPSKQMALIHGAILEGEADIQAGRVKAYEPKFLDALTQDVLDENG